MNLPAALFGVGTSLLAVLFAVSAEPEGDPQHIYCGGGALYALVWVAGPLLF
ncbi:hypothetical protein BOFL111202_17265 [Bordetella flabilis]